MTDRPIIFSAPMVRALLAGRKTQTRRLVRGVPPKPAMDNLKHEPRHAEPYLDSYCSERKTAANPRGMSRDWAWWTRDDRPGVTFKVPAVPGDRLYVREAWAPLSACTHNDPGTQATIDRGFYRADESTVDGEIDRWRPSIHMPRSASRLTLIVDDVRVERLQAITLGDICEEGLGASIYDFRPVQRGFDAWIELWSSLHTKAGERWQDDPFVVALTFRVEHGNIDRIAA